MVAVNDITMQIGPGVTGLLGPNGAGKSTLINLMSGFLAPSSGTVTLGGEPIWHNEQIYRRIGLVPEREAMYDGLTGWDFVLSNAKLHGLSNPNAAAAAAIETVEMSAARNRDIGTYSKGMKQRIKMATALVHEPDVLLLDEPFNGMDPRQRLQLMDLLHTLGDQGRVVLFSSHILEEVEQIAGGIEVMVAGRHAASGDFREIRRLMTERPHEYTIRSSDDRVLAAALICRRLDLRCRGGRRRAERGRPPTTPGSPAGCRCSLRNTVSACSRSPPPTNPWKKSSPTWWPDEHDHCPTHLA